MPHLGQLSISLWFQIFIILPVPHIPDSNFVTQCFLATPTDDRASLLASQSTLKKLVFVNLFLLWTQYSAAFPPYMFSLKHSVNRFTILVPIKEIFHMPIGTSYLKYLRCFSMSLEYLSPQNPFAYSSTSTFNEGSRNF